MQSFAEGKNSDSGGLEVLELLVKVKASPRSLKSFCRLAVRRHLTPPIVHEVDIDQLPLPYQVKRYVAIGILWNLGSSMIPYLGSTLTHKSQKIENRSLKSFFLLLGIEINTKNYWK